MRTDHIAWWNLENLFDEENAVALGRRTDKVFRAIRTTSPAGRHSCVIARSTNLLAGQPEVVVPLRSGGSIDLGEDLQRLPPLTLQGLTQHGLGLVFA
jgi:hypothetical protein